MPRKQHKYHYIYKTTCLITGRYYIGMHSTSNLEDDYIGSGQRLWKSIKKHGRENHVKEILEFLPNRSSLKNREKELVNESLLLDPNCMNLMIGGEGGKISDEQQKRRSAAGGKKAAISGKNKERKKYLWENDESWRNSYKKKLSESAKGNSAFLNRKHSSKTKKQISITNSLKQKGKNNSQFGTCWITKNLTNKRIKKEELNYYLILGWIKGAKFKK